MKDFILLSMNAHKFLFFLTLMGELHACIKYRINLKKNIS